MTLHLDLLNPQDVIKRLPQFVLDFASKTWAGQELNFAAEHYYSKVRLLPDTISADGSNNVTYTFNQGHFVSPFMYGQTDTPSGFTDAAHNQATLAETNLQVKRQTNDTAIFLITGIGVMPCPTSDPVMLQHIVPDLYLTGGFGGDVASQYKFGNILFMPGGGGIYGGGWSQGIMPSLADTQAVLSGGFVTNGLPGDGNYKVLSDPIAWFPNGGTAQESQWGMQLTFARAVTYIADARTAGAGVAAVTPPAVANAAGTFVDLYVRLYGLQLKPRSKNR